MEFTGLSEAKAGQRLKEYGPNELKREKEPGLLTRFISNLADPLIYILLAAAAVSFLLKESSDAFIILAVVFMNGVIGVIQEGKARKALMGLEKLTAPHALVIREGRERRIEASMLVPGDFVVITAGAFIPADGVLVESINLKCDESSMSGESVPVEKHAGDKLFMSTSATYGRGICEITATGMDTRIGRIAGLAQSKVSPTPLQKRLGELGMVLSILAVFLCVALFLLALMQKRPVGTMLLTAISLAVAAVPEGMPAVVTIVLALSVSGLVRVNTIVKRLPSVETLGCVSTVCSDKTGTLTQNKMTVMRVWQGFKEYDAGSFKDKDKRLMEAFVLCNDAGVNGNERIGDPTELALLDYGMALGMDINRLRLSKVRLSEIPFSSEKKRMASLHKEGDKSVEYMKGAVSCLLPACDRFFDGKRTVRLTGEIRKKIMDASHDMSSRALRVLGAACLETAQLSESGLIFLGFVGMMDPVRPEACDAIEDFKNAGVRTIMITGDDPVTAGAIGDELRLSDRPQCITGAELDRLTDSELSEKIGSIDIFARVSPEHKCRIVKALKEKGEIAAMTGDGTNDAPALKMADIGIAMGTGTDVARSAADFVLADDNFASIRDAIGEGRSIYKNIKKSLVFLLSSNLGEIITMFFAVLLGLPAPLKPSHILWINLITDSLPALALGCDINDKKRLMRVPPRSQKEGLFHGGGLFFTLFYGFLIAAISVFSYLFLPAALLHSMGRSITPENLGLALSQPKILIHAQTYAFTVLGLSQLFHALGMRDVDKSFFCMRAGKNRLMALAFFLGIALQLLVTEVPFLVAAFQTARLTLFEWSVLIAVSAVPLAAHELIVIVRKCLEIKNVDFKRKISYNKGAS